MLMEKIIGIIKNVQVKPPNCRIKKNADLIITNKRICCIVLGPSTFISGMIGEVVAGVPGLIAFGEDANRQSDKTRKENIGKELDTVINSTPDSFYINFSEIKPGTATYKTGFFSTLGMFAQLRLKTLDNETYVFDTPNNTKQISKSILSEATDTIIIS